MDSIVRDEVLHYEVHDPSVVHLVNLTPHEVALVGEGGEVILRLPPSGTVARLREEVIRRGTVTAGAWGRRIPVFSRMLGEIEGLPEPQLRTLYVASALVAQAAWRMGRYDVAHPGDLVRDSEGRVIGCRGLVIPE